MAEATREEYNLEMAKMMKEAFEKTLKEEKDGRKLAKAKKPTKRTMTIKATKIPPKKDIAELLQEHEDRLFILENSTRPSFAVASLGEIIAKMAAYTLAAIYLFNSLKKILKK